MENAMSKPDPNIAHDPWTAPRLLALGAVFLAAAFTFVYYISG
jgi:hypothetical protein